MCRRAGPHEDESHVPGYDAGAEDNGNNHFVDFRPVRCALLEHLDEQAVQLEDGSRYVNGQVELPVLTRSATDREVAGALVMAVMNAILKSGFEP